MLPKKNCTELTKFHLFITVNLPCERRRIREIITNVGHASSKICTQNT